MSLAGGQTNELPKVLMAKTLDNCGLSIDIVVSYQKGGSGFLLWLLADVRFFCVEY